MLGEVYRAVGDPVIFQPVSGAAAPGWAMFSRSGMEVMGGDVVITEPALRYEVAAFPAVARGDQFTVEGQGAWRVRGAPVLLLDGREAVVALEQS